MNDVDVIWRRDPRVELAHIGRNMDVVASYDGRKDEVGPLNSGLVYMRSTCRSRIAMKSLLYNIGLMDDLRLDDQGLMVNIQS